MSSGDWLGTICIANGRSLARFVSARFGSARLAWAVWPNPRYQPTVICPSSKPRITGVLDLPQMRGMCHRSFECANMAKFREVGWLIVILLSILSDQIRAISLTREDRKFYDDLKAGRGLYNGDDKVTVLNATNFKNTVYGTSNAWIIEFYNSWCGFCHRFAPVWKSLALDIYGNFIYLIN